MNTKISLFTLFACAVAGTSLLADNENYDGETIAAKTSFDGKSLVNSSWIGAIIGDSSGYVSFQGSDLTGANFTNAEITNAWFSEIATPDNSATLTEAVFTGATITSSSFFNGVTLTNANFENAKIGGSSGTVYFQGADLSGANFTNATITKGGFSTDSTYGTTNLTDAVFT